MGTQTNITIKESTSENKSREKWMSNQNAIISGKKTDWMSSTEEITTMTSTTVSTTTTTTETTTTDLETGFDGEIVETSETFTTETVTTETSFGRRMRSVNRNVSPEQMKLIGDILGRPISRR